VATGRTQDLKQKSKGEAALTSAQLLTQCQEAYEALLGQALDVLVSYDWLSQAASREGLGVSEAAVREEYLSEAKAAFHTPQAFEAYLVKSGLSPADVMLRIRSQLLAAALQKRAEAQASVVTQAQVAAYVATHPPASKTWDVDVVLAHSEQVALKARSEILSGEPWARVAKALSVDPSAASGGLVKDLGAQEADTSLAKALEGSRPGVLVGPFHSDFGYYLIRVISVQGQRPPTLAQREVKARAALASSHESTAWQSFLTSWKAQHKAQTTCLAAYYDPQICGQEASG
jgi:parvulin-like peptidyl-prolyl isomerase